ncbi:MOSC domain-containing protein [Rhizobium sp. SAFR-030]|uniref:MOSC domain-containing protein n=1 Tax=Rhizobium sp. SAFR-030 TaxID=3387277 RepID=UPI003F7EF0DC
MNELGRVIEVWRYPVSSVGGEQLEKAEVMPKGLPGDRHFALFDAETGLAAAPEKDTRWRPALFLSAHYAGEALPSLLFPDGTNLRIDDRKLHEQLRAHFGFEVMVGTYGGKQATDQRLPVVSARYDAACMHIVTTGSLAALARIADLPSIDRRRFRPTLLVDTGEADGFVENDWVGKNIRIGRLMAEVTDGTRRCGMTLAAQPEIAEEPVVLRTIMRHNARNLGVYARATAQQEVAKGDLVYAEI